MNAQKERNMMAAYQGFRGTVTVSAVRKGVPQELFDELTGRQLGMVMTAIDAAYHKGRASTGAEVIDDSPSDGAIWVNAINACINWRRDHSSGELTVSL